MVFRPLWNASLKAKNLARALLSKDKQFSKFLLILQTLKELVEFCSTFVYKEERDGACKEKALGRIVTSPIQPPLITVI
jgi:hypothetical protein